MLTQKQAILNSQTLALLEDDISRVLQHKKKRLAHSLSVASWAQTLAARYGCDESLAYAAGLLHDWYKAYSNDEQIEMARELKLDFVTPYELVAPLLHGFIAAKELPLRYPELPPEIFQAIERHTVGAPDMSELDMVLFVADYTEPLRPPTDSIEAARKLIEKGASLQDVFVECLSGSIAYVIQTKRYLWPLALETYNTYVV